MINVRLAVISFDCIFSPGVFHQEMVTPGELQDQIDEVRF